MNEVLAYYRYPKPKGTSYFENELKQPDKVIEVFDYCQILRAYIRLLRKLSEDCENVSESGSIFAILNEFPEKSITKAGWDFLIKHYGYEKLFELDKISGWFDCSNIGEFIERVQYECDIWDEID